jgi:hypothetical protein
MKINFSIIVLIALICCWHPSSGSESIGENRKLQLFAIPSKTKVAIGDKLVINLIVINFDSVPKKIIIPRNPNSGFDCKGGYYSSRDRGFWRSGELQLSKVTTNPKLVELQAGESIEVEVEVELFESKSDSRQFCVFNVQLTGDASEHNSLESNKVVVWKSK